MMSAVFNPFIRGWPPPRGNTARLRVGVLGVLALVAGAGEAVSIVRSVGLPGHARQVVAGLALALFGLGLLLTAILRKGNQVPFDY